MKNDLSEELSVIMRAHELLAKFIAEDPTQENLDILMGFTRSVRMACIVWLEPVFHAISTIAIMEGLRTGTLHSSEVKEMLIDLIHTAARR